MKAGGLGFRVWGLGFRVWGLGFGVWGLGFGVWGSGRLRGLGFRKRGFFFKLQIRTFCYGGVFLGEGCNFGFLGVRSSALGANPHPSMCALDVEHAARCVAKRTLRLPEGP